MFIIIIFYYVALKFNHGANYVHNKGIFLCRCVAFCFDCVHSKCTTIAAFNKEIKRKCFTFANAFSIIIVQPFCWARGFTGEVCMSHFLRGHLQGEIKNLLPDFFSEQTLICRCGKKLMATQQNNNFS